ncbi:MAG: CHASE2 domain-containing protein [Thermonemataceae bacterium]
MKYRLSQKNKGLPKHQKKSTINLFFFYLLTLLVCCTEQNSLSNEIVIINASYLDRNDIGKIINHSTQAKVIGINFLFRKQMDDDSLFLTAVEKYKDKLIFTIGFDNCQPDPDTLYCDLINNFFSFLSINEGFSTLSYSTMITTKGVRTTKEKIMYSFIRMDDNQSYPHFGLAVANLYEDLPLDIIRSKKAYEVIELQYPQDAFELIEGKDLLNNPEKYQHLFKDKIVLIGYLGKEIGYIPLDPIIEEDYSAAHQLYQTIIIANQICNILEN